MLSASLLRRAVSEALGSFFLLAAIVGSGIMGERLSGGNVALALLANSIATGAALAALILALSPISGAHFNPLVTAGDAWSGGGRWSEVPTYVAAQTLGAVFGVCTANAMFGYELTSWSQSRRAGWSLRLSEFVATFGLIAVIRGCSRRESSTVAFAVGAYIAAAYWFTSSTSFANPSVTLARSLTDTFAGIDPADVPGFVSAQLAGAAAASLLFRWLLPAPMAVSNEEEAESDGPHPVRLSS
ncbi:MAG: aquaporin [Vicinamibacteria bacterium]